MYKVKKAPATHLGGATGDFNRVTPAPRFRRIDSRGGAPAEPRRRWEANYKLKLGQALASRVPLGAAGGRELRRGENKECLAVFGSMMTGALVARNLPVSAVLSRHERLHESTSPNDSLVLCCYTSISLWRRCTGKYH